ncbi:Uncharacterised protein [Chlamydia trachomatis]|nr:Uncharacterised protein [Chlamydia trachomatis]
MYAVIVEQHSAVTLQERQASSDVHIIRGVMDLTVPCWEYQNRVNAVKS